MVLSHRQGDPMINGTTGGAAAELPKAAAPRRAMGPPGVLFYAMVVGAILLAIETNTRQSLGLLMLAVPVWCGIAGVWLIRLLIALRDTRGRMPAKHWIRWLAIPLAMGLVFTVTRTDTLVQARFDLSRGALDSMALDIEGGGSLERGWVGLYNVGTAERTANGFWFVIDDSGLGRWGLAYSPDGEPQVTEENFGNGLWTGAWFEHLDGPWWIFQQEWD
jgi:hypothetical protein